MSDGYYRLSDVNKGLTPPLPVKNKMAEPIGPGEDGKKDGKTPMKKKSGLPATKSHSKQETYQDLAEVMLQPPPPPVVASPYPVPAARIKPPSDRVTTPKNGRTQPQPKINFLKKLDDNLVSGLDNKAKKKPGGRNFLKETSGLDFFEEDGTSNMEDKTGGASMPLSNAVSFSDPKYKTMALLPSQFEPFQGKPQPPSTKDTNPHYLTMANIGGGQLSQEKPSEGAMPVSAAVKKLLPLSSPLPPSREMTPARQKETKSPCSKQKKKKPSKGKEPHRDKKKSSRSGRKQTFPSPNKMKKDKIFPLPDNVKYCPPLAGPKLPPPQQESSLPSKLQKWLDDPNCHGSDPVEEDDAISKNKAVLVANLKSFEPLQKIAKKGSSIRKKSTDALTGGTGHKKSSDRRSSPQHQQIWAYLYGGTGEGAQEEGEQQPQPPAQPQIAQPPGPQSQSPQVSPKLNPAILGPDNLPPNVKYCPPKGEAPAPGSGRKYNVVGPVKPKGKDELKQASPSPPLLLKKDKAVEKVPEKPVDKPKKPIYVALADLDEMDDDGDEKTSQMKKPGPTQPAKSPKRNVAEEVKKPAGPPKVDKQPEKPKKKTYAVLGDDLDEDTEEEGESQAGKKASKPPKKAPKAQNVVNCPPLPGVVVKKAPEKSDSNKSENQSDGYEMMNPNVIIITPIPSATGKKQSKQ